MRLEIRASGGAPCEHCKATELLLTGDNRSFERDLLAHFAQETKNPLKRRRFKHFVSEIERVAGELRAETRRL